MQKKQKLLIVDDEKTILELLKTTLKEEYEVHTAENGVEALAVFDKTRFDMVLTDIRMPGVDGLQLLKTIKQLSPKCEILLMTGFADTHIAVSALNEGAFALITKPLNMKNVLQRLNHVSAVIRQRENQEKVLKEMKTELIMQSLFAERLSALAAMAGGIAHELHQPLSGIGLYAATLENMVKEKNSIDPVYLLETLKKINSQVERAAVVIEHMKKLSSGKGNEELVTLNLKQAIEKSLELFNVQLDKHGINLKIEAPKNIYIQTNMNRFEQVLINLTSNARDSIIEKSSKLKSKEFDKNIHILCRKEKENILIDLSDKGVGVPNELRKNLFEPFITSKKKIKGSGLGLAICKRILFDYNADIELLETSAKGTTFRIRFPAVKQRTEER